MKLNPHPQLLKTAKFQQEEQVSLPYKFTPRPYQVEHLFRPMFPHHFADLREAGVKPKKRIVNVWHRRAGKDLSDINIINIAANERIGNYLYLFPEQTTVKKAIWRGIDKQGIRFLDRIPDSLVKKKYESEMLIEFKKGSTLQFGGADIYDSWMGTNPVGIVFSEYSLQDPMAWTYMRPILRENGGWAIFIFTFRGKNHGYDIYQIAKNNPDTWHHSLLTIDDTEQAPGIPVITPEMYQQEIDEGMPEEIAKQEYYCDPDAALVGSYYGDLMVKAKKDGRVGHYPYNPDLPVYTAWDLGNDANVVGFFQPTQGKDPRMIDYIEKPNTPFSEVCKEVMAKPYTYANHFAPHDVKHRDPETNTRMNTAMSLGIDFFVVARTYVSDGIEAVRQILPRMQFHEVTCERAILALESYHRVYDDKLKNYREQPVHDWSSHCADMMRYMAQCWTANMISDSWFRQEIDFRKYKVGIV